VVWQKDLVGRLRLLIVLLMSRDSEVEESLFPFCCQDHRIGYYQFLHLVDWDDLSLFLEHCYLIRQFVNHYLKARQVFAP